MLFASDITGKSTEGLNFIEKKSAYGVSFEKGKVEGHVTVYLVCMDKKRSIDVYQDESGKVHTVFKINGEDCTLERIYVESKTTLGIPKVLYVDLYGTKEDGTHIYERFKP